MIDETQLKPKEQAPKKRPKTSFSFLAKPKKQSTGRKSKRKAFVKNSILRETNALRIEEDGIVTREGWTDYLLLADYSIGKEPEEIVLQAVNGFIHFFRGFTCDVKIILMNDYINTSAQRNFLEKRTQLWGDGQQTRFHQEKQYELEKVSEKPQRVNYVQIFGKDKEELRQAREELFRASGKFARVQELHVLEKKELLYRLHNLGDHPLNLSERYSQESELTKQGEDLAFMSEIAPVGGVKVGKHDYFTRTAHGWLGVMTLHKYSKKENYFYGNRIFRQPTCITTIDIKQRDINEVQKKLSATIGDKEGSKTNSTLEAKKNYSEIRMLNGILDDVVENNEMVKEVLVRYYLTGETRKDIWAQSKEINDYLSPRGYRANFFLGDEEMDYRALFSSLSAQSLRRKRQGKDLTTTDLGRSYFLDHSQLIDPKGLYFGYTDNNGMMLLDMYHTDQQRLSYNFLLLGVMGSGKSTTAKKYINMNQVLGNYDYVFAVNKEFNGVAEANHGVVIDASGSNGASNVFQVYAVIVNEETGVVDDKSSLDSTIAKVITILRNLTTQKNHPLFESLQGYLKDFYEDYFKKNGMNLARATQYPSESYPIAEDFYTYMYHRTFDENRDFLPNVKHFEQERLYDLLNLVDTKMIQSNGQRLILSKRVWWFSILRKSSIWGQRRTMRNCLTCFI